MPTHIPTPIHPSHPSHPSSPIGLSGLAISFALNVTQSLNWTVRMASDMEANMVSIERIEAYIKLDTEAAMTTGHDPPASWPTQGSVTFQNLSLRYRPDLPLVLKSISFRIPPSFKIGVVGRTGAGKSSLMLALMRLVEPSEGTILIDGVDIRTIGMVDYNIYVIFVIDMGTCRPTTIEIGHCYHPTGSHTVLWIGPVRIPVPWNRPHTYLHIYHIPLSICHHSSITHLYICSCIDRGIPTSPTPLTPIVRSSNLDPFNERTDQELMESLTRVQLVPQAITSLDQSITEGGSNFSVGQRQLLCIARALVGRCRIIIMDEATASIDVQTDQQIQKAIREQFSGCTCLTVAHRLNTIMDSDRVLVMDHGSIAEYDTPATLMANPSSIFKGMVDSWDQEN